MLLNFTKAILTKGNALKILYSACNWNEMSEWTSIGLCQNFGNIACKLLYMQDSWQ